MTTLVDRIKQQMRPERPLVEEMADVLAAILSEIGNFDDRAILNFVPRVRAALDRYHLMIVESAAKEDI